MSGRELLGALVRAAGLVLLVVALIGGAYAIMGGAGAPMPSGYDLDRAVLAAAVYALVGCLLIAFAPEIVRFAYLRDPRR